MVLDLKPPAEATLRALVPLGPLMLSYAVSYLVIAIIWVNHHHLLRFAHVATPELIWWNFAHLFMVLFVPVTTAWMAATRLAPAPVFVYALVFVLDEIAYIAFEHTAFSQATEKVLSRAHRKAAFVRSCSGSSAFRSSRCALFSISLPWSESGLLCSLYLSEPAPARCAV
jgi:uncharacterized membrane protein